MNQEPRHFFLQAPMGRPRLASCGFDPDDHIAEKLPTVVAVLAFEQRKRQDVGRGTLSPVLGIQRRNLVVQRNGNRELRSRVADLSEHANRARSEQAGVDRGELSRSRRQRESNRHSSSESVTFRAAGCLRAFSVRLFTEPDS